MVGFPGRDALHAVAVLTRAGALRPVRPDRLAGAASALLRHGFGLSAGVASGAALHPNRPAVVDDEGELSYAGLDRLVDDVAASLARHGVGPDSAVGILCRNHRGFVAVMVAAGRLGADVVYLNTGFAGPQLADSVTREGVAVLVHDADLPAAQAARNARLVDVADVLADATTAPSPARPPKPPRTGRHVILTSGTTGRPKGAVRETAGAGVATVHLIETLPLRAAQRTLVAAPLFHTWGWAHFSVGLALGATCVLDRSSDPDRLVERIRDDRVEVLATVPAVLQRILDRAPGNLPALRAVLLSGSPLPASLAQRCLDTLGDTYNLYGSTEAGWITVAGPADLQAAPGTAGRPVPGVVLRLIDDGGRDVPRGAVGRIGVVTQVTVAAYTDGSLPRRDGGLQVTGDLGRLDEAGRLYVVGRADDMVVSGGENVYPGEVEDLIAAHPDVVEAAVVGVPDADFGQRLRAVVVRRPDTSITEEDVRDLVRRELARHKVPRDVVFVDALPRNAAGKVLTRELVAEPPG